MRIKVHALSPYAQALVAPCQEKEVNINKEITEKTKQNKKETSPKQHRRGRNLSAWRYASGTPLKEVPGCMATAEVHASSARKLQQDQEVLGSMTKVLQCTSYSQPYPCALLGLSHFLHPGVQGSGVQRI